ncbi:MAG: right-handed parallel beta-helix repeat-containing protein [Candidatus Hodarchaeota archaeon]
MLKIGEEYPEGHEPVHCAFSISNSEGGIPLENIKILNCWVKNYVYGAIPKLDISKKTRDQLRAAHEADETGGSVAAEIEDRLREDAPKDISFINVHFINCHKNGIYVKPYVSKMHFHHGSIVKSGNSAIYLDFGTQKNTISDSVFEDNGRYLWEDNTRKTRGGKPPREAIAVDSSAFNVITGKTFQDNGGGGVFLYKNCFEHADNPKQFPRFQHSKQNRIENNRFYNEPVGVHIASRQSRGYKDWIFKEYMGCGDSVVYESGLPLFKTKYFRDYAEDNDVIGNHFYKNKKAVIVEDDGAEIRETSSSKAPPSAFTSEAGSGG